MCEKFTSSLPERFTKNTLDVCGELGKKRLDDLGQIIGDLSEKWLLSVKKPFPNLSYNFVALCVCENGSEAVLKIALPLNNREIFNEASFLQLSDSKAAVKLLNSDINRRSILLERLMTGKHLKEVFCQEEAKTVEIAIGIMRRILKKPPRNPAFPRLEDWFNNFFIKSPKTNFPFEFLRKTRGFFEELSLAPKFLIHGDLHHENILLAQREPFLIIDPKSVFGNISYEIAVFLNNHFWWLNGQSNLKGKLDVVIERFSEAFEIKLEDLRKWAFCQMVLSAWWTFEDNGENWQPELAFAEFWGKL